MDLKVLVTGSTGFIGGHLVDRLVKEGHEVRCLARNPAKAIRLIDMGLEVVFGDIRNIDSLRPAVKGVDCIFHAAAKVADWGKWEDFKENTVNGTENILKASVEVKAKRFLFISTVDIYDLIFFRSDLPRINECTPIGTDFGRYFYARAKMLAEKKVFECHNSSKINVSVVRPATVYGPRDLTTFPRIIEFVKNKSAGLISGYNPNIGLIYVTDVVDLCVLAATNSIAIGQAYNACTDQDVNIKEFIAEICKNLNISVPSKRYPYFVMIVLANLSEFGSKILRKNKPPVITKMALRLFTLDQRFDYSKALKELTWKPKINFEEGIKNTINWAKEFNII